MAGDSAGALPSVRPSRRRAVRDKARRRDLGGADVDRGVHPWNSRRADTERPDEWRIDLDAMPQCRFETVRRIAHVAHEVLDELGATGWPKTSGGRGLHVYVRIKPEWGFGDVRRAALAFAREVERRAPDDVTTTWWRRDRDPRMLFVDYNQNARDHTIASAYSVRGVPEATVSTPITWDEIDQSDPRDFTIATVPARFAELGDLHAGIDDTSFSLQPLLEWADRDERSGCEPTRLTLARGWERATVGDRRLAWTPLRDSNQVVQRLPGCLGAPLEQRGSLSGYQRHGARSSRQTVFASRSCGSVLRFMPSCCQRTTRSLGLAPRLLTVPR